MTRRGAAVLGLGLVLAAAGLLLGVHDLTRVGALLVALPFIARFLVGRRLDLEVERAVVPAMVAPGSAAIVDLRLRNTGRVTSPQLVAEELGCRVQVTGRLAGVEPNAGRMCRSMVAP